MKRTLFASLLMLAVVYSTALSAPSLLPTETKLTAPDAFIDQNFSYAMAIDGDTAVIGGIYEETINNSVDKVPFLGDIPVLGYLFKTTNRTSEKQELLIFLTPRVIRESINSIK